MAQHIVKLSTASLSNAEDRLLVEKSCSFLRFLLSQMQIVLSMEQKTLWLNPVSCGMVGPAVLKFHSGLWQGEKQEDLVSNVERNQEKENILNQVCLPTSRRGQVIFLFGFAVQGRQMLSVQHCQTTLLGSVVSIKTKELMSKE